MHRVPSGFLGYVMDETHSVGMVTRVIILGLPSIEVLFLSVLCTLWALFSLHVELVVLKDLAVLCRFLACFLHGQMTWGMLSSWLLCHKHHL